jgi:hypothetical protein
LATVKEIIQKFCKRKNINMPTAFVGVNSQTEQQYLSLFEFVGNQLLKMPLDWPQLKRTYIFNTKTNVTRYQLPGDYSKLLTETTRDNTNRWALAGPTSDSTFALLQYGIQTTYAQKSYRLIGASGYTAERGAGLQYVAPVSAGMFEVFPPGSNNTDQLMLQYISKNWVWPKSWATATAYTIGDKVAGVNNVYEATTTGTSGGVTPNWLTGTQSDGGVSWAVTSTSYPISSDDDLCLFDEDVMIEGLRWAYEREKGDDYQQEKKDWENNALTMFSRYNGPTIVNLSDEISVDIGCINIPNGSWSW